MQDRAAHKEGMTTFDESKHPRGTGGQFRETLHAEPLISLGLPGQPKPSAFTELNRLVRNKMEAVRQAEKEMDQILLTGLVMSAREVRPEATQLRLKFEYDQWTPSTLRTEDGSVIHPAPGGDWRFTSPEPESRALTISTMVDEMSRPEEAFSADSRCEFDPENHEWVIHLRTRTSQNEGN